LDQDISILPPNFGRECVSPQVFCDRLVECVLNYSCVVLGDGCHEDPALTNILAVPNLAEKLCLAGLTHILIEHIYPNHIAMVQQNKEEGLKGLLTFLEETTFPPIGTEEQFIEFRSRQSLVYANFVADCCNQAKLTVVGLDSSDLYCGISDRDRLKDLNAHIVRLVQDIRAQHGGNLDSKILIIVGAAHTNSHNGSLLLKTPSPSTSTAGIVDLLHPHCQDMKEMIVVSRVSRGDPASTTDPAYIITTPTT
jgi:hypothetical protein